MWMLEVISLIFLPVLKCLLPDPDTTSAESTRFPQRQKWHREISPLFTTKGFGFPCGKGGRNPQLTGLVLPTIYNLKEGDFFISGYCPETWLFQTPTSDFAVLLLPSHIILSFIPPLLPVWTCVSSDLGRTAVHGISRQHSITVLSDRVSVWLWRIKKPLWLISCVCHVRLWPVAQPH